MRAVSVRVLEVHLPRADLDHREGREGRQQNFRAYELGDSDLKLKLEQFEGRRRWRMGSGKRGSRRRTSAAGKEEKKSAFRPLLLHRPSASSARTFKTFCNEK